MLREKTERPEGIASGNMLLAGTGRDTIVALVKQMFDPVKRAAMSRPRLPFGDGKSAPRIAEEMIRWLAGQDAALRAAG